MSDKRLVYKRFMGKDFHIMDTPTPTPPIIGRVELLRRAVERANKFLEAHERERIEPAEKAYYVAEHIIRSILFSTAHAHLKDIARAKDIVREWMELYILADKDMSSDLNFLRQHHSNYYDRNLHISRVIALAEMMINIIGIIGIKEIYWRILSDPAALEATILELEGIRLLMTSGLRFRLVDSVASDASTYECEVLLPDGFAVPCEMKCKSEGTLLSQGNIESALTNARRKFPADGCGVIFMKIPSEWTESMETLSQLDAILKRWLRNTTRVAEILLYARSYFLAGDQAAHPILMKEVLNERSPHVSRLGSGLIGDGASLVDNPHRWLSLLPPSAGSPGVTLGDEVGQGDDSHAKPDAPSPEQ